MTVQIVPVLAQLWCGCAKIFIQLINPNKCCRKRNPGSPPWKIIFEWSITCMRINIKTIKLDLFHILTLIRVMHHFLNIHFHSFQQKLMHVILSQSDDLLIKWYIPIQSANISLIETQWVVSISIFFFSYSWFITRISSCFCHNIKLKRSRKRKKIICGIIRTWIIIMKCRFYVRNVS